MNTTTHGDACKRKVEARRFEKKPRGLRRTRDMTRVNIERGD